MKKRFIMNPYLAKSIDLANNYDYLDRLYQVYPIAANVRRNIDVHLLQCLKKAYSEQDNVNLITLALKLDLFPIKDAYVAFLKRYPQSIKTNPQTINRLSGIMYEMSWDKFMENITEPKESNRQMGNKFTEWLNKKHLGLKPLPIQEFIKNDNNAILQASDKVAKDFAKEYFSYSRNKGLDFIARFNKKYIIGEAKFLTDFGGHQNAQFEDALSTLNTSIQGAISIAILDGVVFIHSNNKMYNALADKHQNSNILSALLLRDFCYSL